ncbi:hypothetical protein PV327_005721 [Microctonus hyperodae]|uniref:Uncharacterized protein n=1 Tax=Microctonus hyperodae TaxID=165561 RepID=A0AA39KZV0_MICHY|nr:hypothetical protein PV327_005721 [Microctonus hyperodae]
MSDDGTLSALAIEADNTSELPKIINKRRSSIFQRRSITRHAQDNVVDTCGNETEIANDESQVQPVPEEENKFDLNAYIMCLKNEREEWRKTLSERKSQRRRLTKQELNIGNECELDLTVLTNCERSFLSSRPNYHQILKNVNNLVPLAVKIATLNSHINHLHENLRIIMKEKIIESTKQINELDKM